MRYLVLLDGDIGVQHVVYDFSRKVGNRENSSTKNKFCLDLYSYFKEISNIEFETQACIILQKRAVPPIPITPSQML